ncbi:MAG: nicotinate-nucleotide--dimethylbenzimidazole phosphoribosyltransferase [Pseudomonas sp.]|jgi:nicotinate-nucleotide--dimethylbenzimidazole phosphoribosyltransferase|nr:nicotinate-nucleotide--dimethylbenzimidazole phosphoribosyltransferase [Pseudomonas sp.]
MTHKKWWLDATAKLSEQARQDAQAHQNQLTKPQGSLGHLESLAIDLAAMQHAVKPQIHMPHMLIFAADHGIVAQGVSAFPQSVTIAMLANFVNGGAAVATLCKQQGIALCVINCGTASACEQLAQIIHKPIMAGTHDFSQHAAMSNAQALAALTLGKEQVEHVHAKGCDFLMLGEMGIGNTSAASCLSALLLEHEVSTLTGSGTGLEGAAFTHKQTILDACVARATPLVSTPLQALEQVGGLEIAAIAGAYIRASQLAIPCFVDGFITTAAALLAIKLNPEVRAWLLFSHHSAEQGHSALLTALDAKPLLHLGMRLGEGSGAAVAYATVQQALTMHNNMATFSEAAVESKVQ